MREQRLQKPEKARFKAIVKTLLKEVNGMKLKRTDQAL